MTNNIAQIREVTIGQPIVGIGNIGLQNNPGSGVQIFARVISVIIGFLTIVAAIYFLFILITGAISIIGAGGDKNALQNAQRKIVNGIIGIVVTIAAMFIMDLVLNFLGIRGRLDIEAMIQLIRI